MQKKEIIVLLGDNMCKISDVNALFVAQIYASPHYHSNRRTTYTYGISRKCRFHEKHLLHANWQDGQRSINTPSTTIDKRRNFFANDRWRGEKLVRSAYCRYSKPEPEIIKIRCFFNC